MASKVEELRRLSFRMANVLDLENFDIQMSGPDRGSCLLITAHIETELQIAIEVAIGSFGDDDKERDLVEQDGPLATFGRKISMASALRIIGPKFRHNLRLIRHIRNAFAHARVPISYDTPQVAAVCDDLHLINPLNLDVAPDIQHSSVKERFEDVCGATLISLHSYVQVAMKDFRKENETFLP